MTPGIGRRIHIFDKRENNRLIVLVFQYFKDAIQHMPEKIEIWLLGTMNGILKELLISE